MPKKYPTRTDIVTAMQNPQVSFKSTELLGGNIVRNGSKIIQYSGGYSTVFPFLKSNGQKIAVRCWIADIGDAKKRCEEVSKHLQSLKSSYFCDFDYVDNALLVNGTLYPVILMQWIEGETLKNFISSNKDKISAVRENFKKMVKYFHDNDIAHGDLQHGNILVLPDCSLKVIDYDSMYIHRLQNMDDVIHGLPGYQHPKRVENKTLNNKLDYFSELVIYLSLLVFENHPDWWEKYVDTEDLLFSKDDFSNPSRSSLIQNLQSSKNKDIAELSDKLVAELNKSDITLLEPLENHLVNKQKIIIDTITDKWNKQPNPPEPQKTVLPDIKSITDKF